MSAPSSEQFTLPIDDPGDQDFPSDGVIRMEIWDLLTELHGLAPGTSTSDQRLLERLGGRLEQHYPNVRDRALSISQMAEIPRRYRGNSALQHRMVEQCKMLAAAKLIKLDRERLGTFKVSLPDIETIPSQDDIYHKLDIHIRENPYIQATISDFANEILHFLSNRRGYTGQLEVEGRTAMKLCDEADRRLPVTPSQLIFNPGASKRTQSMVAVRAAISFLEELKVINVKFRKGSKTLRRIGLTDYGRQLRRYEDAVDGDDLSDVVGTDRASLTNEEKTRRLFKYLQHWPLPTITDLEIAKISLLIDRDTNIKDGNFNAAVSYLWSLGILRRADAGTWLASGSAMCIGDEDILQLQKLNRHQIALAWLAIDQLAYINQVPHRDIQKYHKSIKHHLRFGLHGFNQRGILDIIRSEPLRYWNHLSWIESVVAAMHNLTTAKPKRPYFIMQALIDEVVTQRRLPTWVEDTPTLGNHNTMIQEVFARCATILYDLAKEEAIISMERPKIGDPNALPSKNAKIFPSRQHIDNFSNADNFRLSLENTSKFLPNLDLDVWQYLSGDDRPQILIDDVQIATTILEMAPEWTAPQNLIADVHKNLQTSIRSDGREPPWIEILQNDTTPLQPATMKRRIDRILRTLVHAGLMEKSKKKNIHAINSANRTELYKLLGESWWRGIGAWGDSADSTNDKREDWAAADWMYDLYIRLLPPAERNSSERERERASKRFEYFCADLFAAKANQQAEVMGGADDGGIDVLVSASVQDGKMLHGIQCKQYMGNNKVGRLAIDSIYSAITAEAASRSMLRGAAILISSNSAFEDEALERVQSLNNEQPNSIILIDGFRLLDMVVHTSTGLLKQIDGTVEIDDAYFDDLDQRVEHALAGTASSTASASPCSTTPCSNP